MPADDAHLVSAACAGDRGAADELLRRHLPRVHAVCRRLLGNEADAADATQEALIAIVRGLPRFDGRSAFGTWVYRVATNAALDELRRRQRRPQLVRDPADWSSGRTEPADPGAEADADAFDDRDRLVPALGALREEYRVAVVLRDVADLDYAEIAEILGVPPGTVRSRIARGRAQLADALGNQTADQLRPTDDHD